MFKAYRYRLIPNDEQKVQLAKTFGCCRFVYNQILARKIDLYKNSRKSISKTDCNNYCNRELKNEFIWLKEVDKFALTNAIYDLDTAYQNFFREIKNGNKNQGLPKFKSKRNRYYSYKTNFTNNNIKVDFENNRVQLPKLKWISCKLHRQFDGVIQSATIKQYPSGKYFISILVDTDIRELPKNNNIIAFDLGVKEFLVDSNDKHIDNPKTIYKYEQKLAKLQRQFAKKQKGSNNWNKHRIKVARLHEKIANIRIDFLNRLSSQIINDNQVIISEDLNIKGMLKDSKLAKSISDVSWGEFTRQLEYKADWYGRTYHKIDRWFASSQTCSSCEHKNKSVKLLTIRKWECDKCKTIHQRDENASINILNKGLKELGLFAYR
ncbi:IS200/IS605 family element RNA-guided endonuclease TnpB [Chengkuizengella sediminis]|uniref:IS200/IS605 family element RNA-guided endonuclease TnpB n=1 Tax=Chengkuizengella sediminis TaxID=1885917 RepID=UPI0013898546|nr:IS200/IS605 family element RNA-guided endonuclease TnpB [Chengkuizengella sediminis]NDI34758.1 IS200/IS605 family element transposase accessory protein TnpB [Chengkuizengella sediminis]